MPSMSNMKEYAILTLPIVTMMLFGLFGHRSGQIKNKCLSFLMNFICFINYLILCVVTINYLRLMLISYDYALIFYAGVCILFVIYYTFLLYICYKNYNLFCLLQDVRGIRKMCMQKKNTIYILIMFVLIIINFSASISFSLYSIVVPAFKGSDVHFTIKTSNPTLNGFVALIEAFLFPIVQYSLMVIPSFMVNVLSTVIANEFNKFNEDFENSMEKRNALSVEELSKMTDRFYDLTLIVNKVDAMFAYPVALSLVASLGSLCMTVYKTVKYNANLGTPLGSLNVSVSVLTLMLLFPSLTSLNTKVNNRVFHKLSTIANCFWLCHWERRGPRRKSCEKPHEAYRPKHSLSRGVSQSQPGKGGHPSPVQGGTPVLAGGTPVPCTLPPSQDWGIPPERTWD